MLVRGKYFEIHLSDFQYKGGIKMEKKFNFDNWEREREREKGNQEN